jgi:SAM-dependent methyltransferase
MPDWGLGSYESTALELEPVARRVASMAAPLQGRRVLDIACGTGNAALLAAEAGASVVGLDQAPRLIEVAKKRAAARGLEASFVVGDAEEIDFAGESFDVALSVFGVIFAPNPERAFAEIVRVLRPGGRALLTVWLPGGTVDAMVDIVMRAVNAATGHSHPSGLAWHDAGAVGDLAARHGATVAFHEGEISFVADSPEAYLAINEENHPMAVGVRPILKAAGTGEAVHDDVLAVLKAGNEDPSAFKVTSRYRVIEVTR